MTVAASPILADSASLLGGSDLIVWLVLALGAAMLFGNVMALLRPKPRTKEGDLDRAPVVRSAVMATLGAIAALWALASLVVH
jgi:hypothetical protein